MKNNYEIRGEKTIIFFTSKRKTIETVIDTDDLEKVSSYRYTWTGLNTSNHKTYVHLMEYDKKKFITLHRLLMNATIGTSVDHINGDTLDNRKCNLRIVKHVENMQNLKLRTNNSSGYRGVSWNKQKNKWAAYAKVDKKLYRLGYFSDILDAADAVKQFRICFMPFSNESLAVN